MKNVQETIFGVPVWGFFMNEQKYQCRDYLDHLYTLRETEPSVKKSNFGGYQTHDNLHLAPVFREFCSGLEKFANTIASEYTNKNLISLKVTEMWGNINTLNCYNAAHVHGGILSGVFYIKTPKDCGRLILKNPAVRSDLHLIRTSNYPIVPEPLACIIFPSWLEHYVEPNMSDEERVSISFNFDFSE